MVIVFNKSFIVSLATKKVAISGLNIFEKKNYLDDYSLPPTYAI